MRDRFPLLLIAGFVLLAVLGSSILRSATRGEFAGPRSTYRSEGEGARAIYLLAEESGLAVGREKRDLEIIDEGTSHVLLGLSAGYKVDSDGDAQKKDKVQPKDKAADKAKADGGTPGDDDELDETSLPFFLNRGVLSKSEREKLLEHVKAGHTLVYVPQDADEDALLREVGLTSRDAGKLEPKLRSLVPAQPSPYTLDVERVEAEVTGYLSSDRAAVVPLLKDDHTQGTVAALAPYGAGRVIVIEAPELATNKALLRADNARLWLSLLAAAAGRDRLLFDEYHHGFRDERSIAAFAARYGLHLAVAQLLLGLCLWAASLRRFGRPRAPLAEARVGGVDVLSAAGRLYRAGKHHGHAAQLIADGLCQHLAPLAGAPLHAKAEEVATGLRARGRADLAAGLNEVGQLAQSAASEHDVLKTARTAARVRQLLRPFKPQRTGPNRK